MPDTEEAAMWRRPTASEIRWIWEVFGYSMLFLGIIKERRSDYGYC